MFLCGGMLVSYFMSEVLRRLPVALLRRTRGQLLAFPHKLRDPGGRVPLVAQFRPKRGLPSASKASGVGPSFARVPSSFFFFFGGLSLSLDGGCGFYKSVHAAPYGSWTPRIGFMSSVFFVWLYFYIYIYIYIYV